jgi:SET domain-containing protein
MSTSPPEIYRTRAEISRFFKNNGLVYLERTRIAWKPLLSMDLSERDYYLENREFFEEANHRYARFIKDRYMAPLYIRKIDSKVGYGVFAQSELAQDAFIGEYTGVIQRAEEKSGRELEQGGYESDYAWYYLEELEEAPDLEINGRFEGNELRYVNHGDRPNVDVEHVLIDGHWILFFKAAKKIAADEQLLINYGNAYWEDGWRDLESL